MHSVAPGGSALYAGSDFPFTIEPSGNWNSYLMTFRYLAPRGPAPPVITAAAGCPCDNKWRSSRSGKKAKAAIQPRIAAAAYGSQNGMTVAGVAVARLIAGSEGTYVTGKWEPFDNVSQIWRGISDLPR